MEEDDDDEIYEYKRFYIHSSLVCLLFYCRIVFSKIFFYSGGHFYWHNPAVAVMPSLCQNTALLLQIVLIDAEIVFID